MPVEDALEPWERDRLADIREMAADPSWHKHLCRTYCHEGFKATRHHEEGGRHFVDFGICSRQERAEVPRAPSGTLDPAKLASDAADVDRAALARLVAHILARAELGELGC